jgi:hypothetical protein
MYDVWWLGFLLWAVYVFMYFDMFFIQWHHLVEKDPLNRVYMIVIMMSELFHVLALILFWT